MKVSAAVLAALLLLALCSPAVAHLDNALTKCCFRYLKRPVPRSLITSYYITSSSCSLKAVILVTKNGRKLCVNPSNAWVQSHLKYLHMKKSPFPAAAATPTAANKVKL